MQRKTDATWNVHSQVKLFAIDLETACAVEGCDDKHCRHALDHNRNKITVIAVSDGGNHECVFRSIDDLLNWVESNPNVRFTAHSGKFDFKQLLARAKLPLDLWVHDSCLLAFTSQDKIDETWLEDYEFKRREANKLRKGHKHREAKHHSLKTLAPYFLGVQPFWEPEDGHDNDEYVLKDARYCAQLTNYFIENLPEKSYEFYTNRYLPWNKMLLKMELKGILCDMDKMADMWRKSEDEMFASEGQTRLQWASHYEEWLKLQEYEVEEKYHAMELMAKTKGRWSEKIAARHEANKAKAFEKIEPLNLDSPKQLLWLVRDRLGLDATNLDGEESTDKETLTRLGAQNEEVKVLLNYRKAKKLCSTYFPEYKNYAYNGRIHATFNTTAARTGRLSCSDPNLQQVPGALHDLFMADRGKLLITRDLSAIEPTVLAYYSEDPTLCQLMLEGGDFHGTTAVAAFDLDCHPKEVKALFPKMRNIAKTVGLAILYGAGKNQVYLTLQKEGLLSMTKTDAERIVKRVREQYKGVWEFKQALDKELESGCVVYNLLGRPLAIKNPEDVYMKGLNTLIQSSASDLLQQAAYEVWSEGIAEPLLLVHDEMVCQAKESYAEEAEEKIVKIMTKTELKTAYGNIPIRCEGKINRYWSK
jgi:DNA polymerase I-like protein with 3'-5' exonuclease and polymerase domains